ncbi:hypothetical protein ACHAW6_001507 [Cyclotella cf. meneghiniana]
MKDYLWVPDKVDLHNINELHRHVRGVDIMLGSLDCSHTIWKKCSKAWAGSYQGKEINPSIVLEDISYYHMFFGMHLMDIQVPSMTKQYLTCHHFKNVFWMVHLKKKSYHLVLCYSAFQVSNLTKCSSLLMFSRFVKGIKAPLTRNETRFTT